MRMDRGEAGEGVQLAGWEGWPAEAPLACSAAVSKISS